MKRLGASLAFIFLIACGVQRPRLVYSEVVGHRVPELKCDGGTPSRNTDGAITGCLGPAER